MSRVVLGLFLVFFWDAHNALWQKGLCAIADSGTSLALYNVSVEI